MRVFLNKQWCSTNFHVPVDPLYAFFIHRSKYNIQLVKVTYIRLYINFKISKDFFFKCSHWTRHTKAVASCICKQFLKESKNLFYNFTHSLRRGKISSTFTQQLTHIRWTKIRNTKLTLEKEKLKAGFWALFRMENSNGRLKLSCYWSSSVKYSCVV